METIWEKVDEINGGCRTSALLPETTGSMFKITGGTRSMRIIQKNVCNSSSSSSIGDDSDGDGDRVEDDEIESRYNFDNHNGSFNDAIQALEQALPIRRGISTFYNGKSKSFTSLTDVGPSTTSSIQEIAKPENAYTRKRRNLSAFNLSNINTGRVSKKPKPTTLQFTLERENQNFTKHNVTQSQVNRQLPLRSFSMVNLLHCGSTKIGNC